LPAFETLAFAASLRKIAEDAGQERLHRPAKVKKALAGNSIFSELNLTPLLLSRYKNPGEKFRTGVSFAYLRRHPSAALRKCSKVRGKWRPLCCQFALAGSTAVAFRDQFCRLPMSDCFWQSRRLVLVSSGSLQSAQPHHLCISSGSFSATTGCRFHPCWSLRWNLWSGTRPYRHCCSCFLWPFGLRGFSRFGFSTHFFLSAFD